MIGAGGKKATGREFSFKQESGAVVKYRMAIVAGKFCAVSTTTADAEAARKFLQSFVPK